ncbi:efflux pump antibiotic resistance protein [Emericellopsis atlantica]|uniref:Efflux pump antibiotic resistance protein n=1 Tax=Emericellopsis atlantica TaxID=2614577 RepID=A0A9P7ZR90_9HYPO|nr:efflux pump antibiotic resistance protein [Emericellopsis atlantica]KAG9256220.1 efflux pump antibiotic resistance protein [Emericellopsis atlantica]
MSSVQERHPELFVPLNRESPRGRTRTVPMQVLCLGFNRTGTSTMSAALEALGIPCWHSFQLLSAHFGDNEKWLDILERKFFPKEPYEPIGSDEFDQLLSSFGAVSSDTPAICFAEELVAAYPEAKVVLIERDIDNWYESYMHSIVTNVFDPMANLLIIIERSYFRSVGLVQKRAVEGWAGIHSYKEGARKAKNVYRAHYALVSKITPKERLLEFRLEDGWEPLCQFLGKDVPEEPFPRLNEKNPPILHAQTPVYPNGQRC